jgi:uncharacterized protein YyaL (SSP411 family)
MNSAQTSTGSNRLAKESSPYLLQHARNPVDWYPWGDEAFEKARSENKPVLVSIGYAACHWCHVMERESFEKEDVARIMNENFVSIKVDREERPDVDHVYMDALQAMEGSGGWPLNVFLTPEGKPFYGGTYFPPQRAFNRSSWTEVLHAVHEAFAQRRNEVEEQASRLTEHLRSSNTFGISAGTPKKEGGLEEAFRNILAQADREWGGFGKAPKFPQTLTINFLMDYAHLTGNKEAQDQALLSLDKMCEGGIYDHVGGGFARYSTDKEWLAPHFEKMLYDNALILVSLASAFQLTGNDKYRKVIGETMDFLERELTHPEGGFFSALDADSEGEEGKFYVWDLEELDEVLGEDAPFFCAFYDCSPEGNWEGKNILRTLRPLETVAEENGYDRVEAEELIKRCREKLLSKRSERIRPLLDDKILLNWNGLMNYACSRAFAATGERKYYDLAERNMKFMMEKFRVGGSWKHSWKEGVARHPGFLDDFSCLISALIELAQVGGNLEYWERAKDLAGEVIELFSDEEATYFYYTAEGQNLYFT